MPKTMPTKREATVADLYRVEGKAELVNGELVVMAPAGGLHGYTALKIAASLLAYGERTRSGYAFGDSVGFLVKLPHRRSFSPDAAFHKGAPPDAKFVEGAPVLAVEVRSVDDYGSAAERAIDAKRADYFAAGTIVVWDVDVLREQCVRVYRATGPSLPTVYRRGETAEAEPAPPGWTFLVDNLFLGDA